VSDLDAILWSRIESDKGYDAEDCDDDCPGTGDDECSGDCDCPARAYERALARADHERDFLEGK
jgi:hypothetical protein